MFFSILLLTTACDDGDVLNIQLDFDKELSLCEIQTTNQGSAITSSFLFYDTREDPFESITLLIQEQPLQKPCLILQHREMNKQLLSRYYCSISLDLTMETPTR